VVYNSRDGFLYAESPAGIDVLKPAERFWQATALTQMPVPRAPQNVDLAQIRRSREYRFPPYFRPPNACLPNFFTGIHLTYHLGGDIFDRHNREHRITDRVVDPWLRLWVGSTGMGPLIGDLHSLRLQAARRSIPQIHPRDVFIDEQFIWFGGLRYENAISGITRWDRNRDEWTYFEAPFINNLPDDNVVAIDGNPSYVVFATQLGVAVFNQKLQRWKTFSVMEGLEGDRILDIAVTGDTAFVGSEFGFNWIDLKYGQVYDIGSTTLDHVPVYKLQYDGKLVWAATRYGLYSIDIRKEEIVFHPNRSAIVGYDTRAVAFNSTRLWLAGPNGISYKDTATAIWRSFPGLSFSGSIRDIQSRGDRTWFATDQGLLMYNSATDYWRLFTRRDGLISNDVHHVDIEGKRLWISTSRGVTVFRWQREGRLD
jgi:hypothetical protein